MVLATSQQAAAVFVRSAVPAGGPFTIRLSGAAPTGGLLVAYFELIFRGELSPALPGYGRGDVS